MPQAPLRLIKSCHEKIPQSETTRLHRGLRGIYVLFEHEPSRRRKNGYFNVVYVGLAGLKANAGIHRRLRSHMKRKGKYWTHCSVFEVHDNITAEEIRELEGLFRHIYRADAQASRLNKQRGFRKLRRIRTSLLAERRTETE